MKAVICILLVKSVLFVTVALIGWQLWNPLPICWKDDRFNGRSLLRKDGIDVFHDEEEQQICIKTRLFENFFCAEDPWEDPWWKVDLDLSANPPKFCIARRSTYTAIYIQLFWVIVLALIHLTTLFRRGFQQFDPLDMYLLGLSSTYLILFLLGHNWSELWLHNNVPVPSNPLPNSYLNSVLMVGIGLSVFEWILFHRLYNRKEVKPVQLKSPIPDILDKHHED